MGKVRAVIMKTEGRWMMVATEDRQFLRLPRPSAGASVGQEVWVDTSGSVSSWLSYKRTLVAGIVLLVLLGSLLTSTLIRDERAVAYLALDINPSLELAIDERERVMSVSPLNQDAVNLLRNLSLQGYHLENALDLLIKEASKAGYLSVGAENMVLVTIVNTSQSRDPLTTAKIRDNLVSSLERTEISAIVGVQQASPGQREKARKAGMSLNSYLLKDRASDAQSNQGAVEIARALLESRKETAKSLFAEIGFSSVRSPRTEQPRLPEPSVKAEAIKKNLLSRQRSLNDETPADTTVFIKVPAVLPPDVDAGDEPDGQEENVVVPPTRAQPSNPGEEHSQERTKGDGESTPHTETPFDTQRDTTDGGGGGEEPIGAPNRVSENDQSGPTPPVDDTTRNYNNAGSRR